MKKERRKSTFFKDFKAFISRGSVLDLAVAVVIGGAFTKIVNSLVADVIMPLINALFALAGAEGGVDGMNVVLNGVPRLLADGSINPEAILWNYGNFIQAIIDFLIIALVIFCIIRAIKKAEELGKKVKEEVGNITAKGEKEDEVEVVAEEAPTPAPEPEPELVPEPVVSARTEELLEEILKELRAKKAE